MKKITLNVTGMTCSACAGHVQKALERTPGVRSSRVDLASKKAIVEYDENQAAVERMIEEIREEGYDAAPAEEAA
jgi:Cu+-exporting ATPase